MHPLDTLSKAFSAATPVVPAAITPQLPGGQVVAVVAASVAVETVSVESVRGAAAQPSEELVEIPWPAPCPKCNSYEAWWDILGGQHCQRCEAKQFYRGLRILRLVDRWKKTERNLGYSVHRRRDADGTYDDNDVYVLIERTDGNPEADILEGWKQ